MDTRTLIAEARESWRRFTGGERGLPAPVKAVVRWVLVFYRELERDRAFQRAGALAYGTLVSLVPMLMLIFALLHTLGVLDQEPGAIEKLVFGTFLGDIPEVRQVLLPGLMAINLRAIGAIGTIGWIFVSFRIYMTMEQAYSQIFHVRVSRTLLRRLVNFWLAMTAVPLLVSTMSFGSLEMAARYQISWWGDILGWLVPVVLFSAAIKLLPSTHVEWRPALLGGVISGILIQAGSYGFAWYMTAFRARDPITLIYGSIAIIPVFLLWLWLLWIFVLLGVEIAHVAQNYYSLVEAEQQQRRATEERMRLPSVETAIEVMLNIVWAFHHHEGPIDAEKLATRCGLPPHRVTPIVEVLVARGLAVKAENGWLVARPPTHVRVREVVEAWRGATAIREGETELGRAVAQAVETHLDSTLAEAAERWVIPPAAPALPGAAAAEPVRSEPERPPMSAAHREASGRPIRP